MSEPTYGELFTGIGGMSLGLERAGWTPRWFAENDAYCSRVLAKHWPDVPNWGDVTEVDWDEVDRVELVCGGFPCQPFSSAGLRRGTLDERWMWPAMVAAIRVLRPRLVLLENVADLVTDADAFGIVLGDLSELGFDAEWSVLSACALGAPHPRRRLFVVAYPTRGDEPYQVSHHPFADNGHPDWQGQPRGSGGVCGRRPRWLPEPDVGRVATGIPRRLVRGPLSALGNSCVPQVAEWIGAQLLDAIPLSLPLTTPLSPREKK